MRCSPAREHTYSAVQVEQSKAWLHHATIHPPSVLVPRSNQSIGLGFFAALTYRRSLALLQGSTAGPSIKVSCSRSVPPPCRGADRRRALLPPTIIDSRGKRRTESRRRLNKRTQLRDVGRRHGWVRGKGRARRACQVMRC